MTKQSVIKEFTSLKGLGAAKAEMLYDNGITSMDKLKKSSVKDLSKIKGISEKNAKDILEQLQTTNKKQEIKEKPAEIKKTSAKDSDSKSEDTKDKQQEKEDEKKPQDTVEIIEDTKDEYKAKKKPKLSKEKQKQLHIRKQIKKRTPTFLRQEWFRYKRIPKNWRRPTGITSKLRTNLKYRPSKVRVGFRGPKDTRGLHPSGFEEVMVYNINDLKAINPQTQAGRIGKTVGTKKRLEIAKKAEELDIRILNMKV